MPQAVVGGVAATASAPISAVTGWCHHLLHIGSSIIRLADGSQKPAHTINQQQQLNAARVALACVIFADEGSGALG